MFEFKMISPSSITLLDGGRGTRLPLTDDITIERVRQYGQTEALPVIEQGGTYVLLADRDLVWVYRFLGVPLVAVHVYPPLSKEEILLMIDPYLTEKEKVKRLKQMKQSIAASEVSSS